MVHDILGALQRTCIRQGTIIKSPPPKRQQLLSFADPQTNSLISPKSPYVSLIWHAINIEPSSPVEVNPLSLLLTTTGAIADDPWALPISQANQSALPPASSMALPHNLAMAIYQFSPDVTKLTSVDSAKDSKDTLHYAFSQNLMLKPSQPTH